MYNEFMSSFSKAEIVMFSFPDRAQESAPIGPIDARWLTT